MTRSSDLIALGSQFPAVPIVSAFTDRKASLEHSNYSQNSYIILPVSETSTNVLELHDNDLLSSLITSVTATAVLGSAISWGGVWGYDGTNVIGSVRVSSTNFVSFSMNPTTGAITLGVELATGVADSVKYHANYTFLELLGNGNYAFINADRTSVSEFTTSNSRLNSVVSADIALTTARGDTVTLTDPVYRTADQTLYYGGIAAGSSGAFDLMKMQGNDGQSLQIAISSGYEHLSTGTTTPAHSSLWGDRVTIGGSFGTAVVSRTAADQWFQDMKSAYVG